VGHATEELDLSGHRFTEAIRFLHHLDLHGGHAGDDCFSHHVWRQVVFQHHELAAVAFRGNTTAQNNLVLERIEMRGRIMNRLPGPQHAHAGLKLARLVLNLHNDRGLIEQFSVKMLAQPRRAIRTGGVDERIPIFRGRLKRLASADFFQVGHARYPNPKRA
jgi:hypothetical protein